MACRIENTIGCLAFLAIFHFSGSLDAEILIEPASIILEGPQATHSLLVSSTSSSGQRTDLGRTCSYRSLTPGIVSVTAERLVAAISDGLGRIEIEVLGRKHIVSATVRRSKAPRAYHFENDILPLLAKYGCNSSTCHGKAEGQKGSKFSIFSSDPSADYDAIARDSRRRRVNPASPRDSLLLLKATSRIAHEGGRRFDLQSGAFKTLLGWIAAGMPRGSPAAPRVERIRITPRRARLGLESEQQLQVIARYSDGREIDVTRLSVFKSNNDGLANVDETGRVRTGKVPGQAAVMASFCGAVDVSRIFIPLKERIENYPELTSNNFIDDRVYEQLQDLGILPSAPADDAEFLRRVYIDIIGTLPTASEVRHFLTRQGDPRQKRADVVNRLLERPEYATYWSLSWSDLLRIDRQALGHKAAYSYYRWLRRQFTENRPMDELAEDLLTSEGPLTDSPQGYLYKVLSTPKDAAKDQIVLRVDPARLGLNAEKSTVLLRPGCRADIKVRIRRGAGMNLPVKITLVQPAHVIGIESAAVTVPGDVNEATITLRCAKKAGPFNASLIIRATASENNGDQIVGETNIDAVWLDEAASKSETD